MKGQMNKLLWLPIFIYQGEIMEFLSYLFSSEENVCV